MDHSQIEISYSPCPPEEFAGRSAEKEKLLKTLSKVTHQGQVLVITGARGSGKTSFLDWAEYEIQGKPKGSEIPVIKKAFLETPGTVFITYRDLLTELKEHQKFGWFRKTMASPNVKSSIEVVLGVLETASSLAGTAGLGVRSGVVAARGILPTQVIEYNQLLSAFLTVLRNLSYEFKDSHYLVIICDDAQWTSEPDFQLLKDLIRNLPSGIAFIIAFRLETESMAKYVKLRQELDRFGHSEIRLSVMNVEEIKELATRRYALSIDDSTAQFLNLNIGEPLCLVSCFNSLQRRGLEPSLVNVQAILPEAVDPARCIYSELDQQWKERVNSLCILYPPLPLSLIACMLRIEKRDIVRLQDELNQSVALMRLGKEVYDFAHPSLREYIRKELPEGVAIGLHSQAAMCLEALANELPDKLSVSVSIADHLFLGQGYDKALEPSLRFGDQLYDLFAFSLALRLTDQARICAEKTSNKPILSVAFHQKGLTLQSMFRFTDSLDAYNQSLAIEREIGNKSGEAISLRTIKTLEGKKLERNQKMGSS